MICSAMILKKYLCFEGVLQYQCFNSFDSNERIHVNTAIDWAHIRANYGHKSTIQHSRYLFMSRLLSRGICELTRRAQYSDNSTSIQSHHEITNKNPAPAQLNLN
jgi:hypothetical protein